MIFISKLSRAILLLTATVFLGLAGCSSLPEVQPNESPAQHPVDAVLNNDVTYAIDIYDPWEGLNRGIYRFNAGFDRYVFLPAVSAYSTVMPDFLEDRVSNFFNNLSDIPHLLNTILQLKPQAAIETTSRLIINTTVGIAGFFDVATKMGIYEHDEDFGQTLAHYGVADGPYVVIPLLGPSNLRDSVGLIADWQILAGIDPLNLDDHDTRELTYYLLNGIDARYRNYFRYYDSGSPFEYELVRLLYTKKRQLDSKR